jgi:hypothetical protein
VFWGDWSIVEATVLLLEEARESSGADRFTLLSGTHYPIISNEAIVQRAARSGNIIAARAAPNMPDGSRPESDYERRFFRSRRANGSWARVKNGVANRVLFRRSLDWRSLSPSCGMRAGSPYWSLEPDFVEYCISQIRSSRPLIEYFKKIVCSDEKVFATLFREFSNVESNEGTTFVKWNGNAHPERLFRGDLEKATDGDQYWFARKFYSFESEILDWLDER